MRNDLTSKLKESYLKEKIQKVLLLIQDGVLIINK